jgi:nucleoporin POM152
MAAYGPLIPERLIDAPSQRLYILSLGLALQVYLFLLILSFKRVLTRPEHALQYLNKILRQALKLVAFFTSLIDGNSLAYFLKWILVDIAFLLVLRFLRIPRLTFRWQSSALQTLILAMVNWLLFGNYTVSSSISVSPVQTAERRRLVSVLPALCQLWSMVCGFPFRYRSSILIGNRSMDEIPR